jgi:hypothetical protein
MNEIKQFIERVNNTYENNNLRHLSVERNLLKFNNKFFDFSNDCGGYEANKSFIINNLHNLLNISDESDLYMLFFDEVK